MKTVEQITCESLYKELYFWRDQLKNKNTPDDRAMAYSYIEQIKEKINNIVFKNDQSN